MAKKKQHRSPVVAQEHQSPGTDWIRVVAVLMLFAGVFSILEGIAALVKGDLFNTEELLFADVTTWGWIYIVVGALQIWAAVLVNMRHTAGFLMAITFAWIAGTAHFLSIGVHPVWSIIVMGVNFGILFVLLTRSDEFG